MTLFCGLKNSVNYCHNSRVSQLIFVYIGFRVAKVDYVKRWMVTNHLFQIFRMFTPIYLVILHYQLNHPMVFLYTFHDLLKVCLNLIIGQINFLKMNVFTNQELSNNNGRLESHSLVFQINPFISLI